MLNQLIGHNNKLHLFDIKYGTMIPLTMDICCDNIQYITNYDKFYYVLLKDNRIYRFCSKYVDQIYHNSIDKINSIHPHCLGLWVCKGYKSQQEISCCSISVEHQKGVFALKHVHSLDESTTRTKLFLKNNNTYVFIKQNAFLWFNTNDQTSSQHCAGTSFDPNIKYDRYFVGDKYFKKDGYFCVILLNDNYLYLRDEIIIAISNDDLKKQFDIEIKNIHNIWILGDSKKYCQFIQLLNGIIHIVDLKNNKYIDTIDYFDKDCNIEIIDNPSCEDMLIIDRTSIYSYTMYTNNIQILHDNMNMDYFNYLKLGKTILTKNTVKHCGSNIIDLVKYIILCNKHTGFIKLPIYLVLMISQYVLANNYNYNLKPRVVLPPECPSVMFSKLFDLELAHQKLFY